MRLWHKDLVEVLPRQQLLGQWRECCAIAKNISTKGTPGHLLVNKIMGYSSTEFLAYSFMVYHFMIAWGYSADWDKFLKKYSPDMHDKIDCTWEQYSEERLNKHNIGFPYMITIKDHGNGAIYLYRPEDIFPGWHNWEYLDECYYNLREKWNCGGIPDDEWDRFEKRYFELKEICEEQTLFLRSLKSVIMLNL